MHYWRAGSAAPGAWLRSRVLNAPVPQPVALASITAVASAGGSSFYFPLSGIGRAVTAASILTCRFETAYDKLAAAIHAHRRDAASMCSHCVANPGSEWELVPSAFLFNAPTAFVLHVLGTTEVQLIPEAAARRAAEVLGRLASSIQAAGAGGVAPTVYEDPKDSVISPSLDGVQGGDASASSDALNTAATRGLAAMREHRTSATPVLYGKRSRASLAGEEEVGGLPDFKVLLLRGGRPAKNGSLLGTRQHTAVDTPLPTRAIAQIVKWSNSPIVRRKLIPGTSLGQRKSAATAAGVGRPSDLQTVDQDRFVAASSLVASAAVRKLADGPR